MLKKNGIFSTINLIFFHLHTLVEKALKKKTILSNV